MLGVATSLLNNAAAPFGDAAIAGIAVVQRITSVANFVQIGIGQGFQPITGYNLGAKRYDRIQEAYFTAIKMTFVSVAAIGVITFIWAPQLIAIFRDDPAVVAFGTLTLRLSSITMPFTGAAMVTNFLLQTSGLTAAPLVDLKLPLTVQIHPTRPHKLGTGIFTSGN
jgi:Na+-driven multidrug efflux pump